MRTPTILLVTGLIFFVLAELGGMAQLRVFAVLLLIAGAAGMGVLAGGAPPSRLAARAAGLLRSSAAVIVLLLLAPTFISLALAVLQALVHLPMPWASSSSDANTVWHGGWSIAGALTASLLLAAAATALAVALRAMRAASHGEKPSEAL